MIHASHPPRHQPHSDPRGRLSTFLVPAVCRSADPSLALMELLSLSRPLPPPVDLFAPPLPSFPASSSGFGTTAPISSASGSSGAGEEGRRLYVALGRSTEKGDALLRWAIGQFRTCHQIVLVHVYQPSLTIPTPLGNIPASRANEVTVEAFRREETKNIKKLLFHYAGICRRAQIQVTQLVIENKHVPDGIVDLVNAHNIKTLIMGISSKNNMKVKRTLTKAAYVEKNAPQFCEIWFVLKDKLVRMKNSTETSSRSEPGSTTGQLPGTFFDRGNELPCDLFDLRDFSSSNSCEESRNLQIDPLRRGSFISTSSRSFTTASIDQGSVYVDVPMSLVSQDLYTSGDTFPLESARQQEFFQAHFIDELNGTHGLEADAFPSSSKSQNGGFRMEGSEVSNMVAAYESAFNFEPKVRREREDLRRLVKKKDALSKQTAAVASELQKSIENITLLENRIQEAAGRRYEFTEELKKTQASIVSLKIERHRIRQQQEEAVGQLEQLKCCDAEEEASCSEFNGSGDETFGFTVFSLSDLQTATCDFSGSFLIGRGSYGCVYKGEMLNRSVAIKKLYPRNMQGQMEFQEEVSLLRKLKHPNLVALLGVCPEAWSLIYEYVPNGSLQDHLSCRTSATRWLWKARIRAAAEISRALLFLHSSEPQGIVHGNLKPENILLDSDISCKISDLGISKLAPEETFHCPSFHLSAESKGAFSYMDPEYRRTGQLTPKSDVYAFGIIMLQLLTGRPPDGLAYEVRMAMSRGRLSSVLDATAGEWPVSVATRLAELSLECCEDSSSYRPELTEAVVRELEQLHVLDEQSQAPNFFLCPILKEVMYDPHIAADGFTYEGRAIRGWLEKGRETSPMTNLDLPHLMLTPNHALRMAIQDWLFQSKCQSR